MLLVTVGGDIFVSLSALFRSDEFRHLLKSFVDFEGIELQRLKTITLTVQATADVSSIGVIGFFMRSAVL